MDIFKILSRSTHLNRPNTAHLDANLPSSGQAVNPQLFGGQNKQEHHEAGDSGNRLNGSGSRKRKRNQSGKVESAGKCMVAQTHTGKSNWKTTTSGAKGDNESILNEENCRRCLREHKLKVMLLDDPKPISQSPKKASKSKPSAPVDATQSGTLRKLPLYPKPLLSFEQLRTRYDVSRRLVENIKTQGYGLPTEVQIGSLPLLLPRDASISQSVHSDSGKSIFLSPQNTDLLCVAPTGSGKTLAFLIPTLDQIIKDHQPKKVDKGSKEDTNEKQKLRAVIVAPTKELVDQIVNEARKLAEGTGVRITAMRKGMLLFDPQTAAADRLSFSGSSSSDEDESDDDESLRQTQKQTKVDVLVTTPHVLFNAIISGEAEATLIPLPTVTHLILDEADILLDPLFREQTLHIWSSCTSQTLRVSLWSATIGSSIETLALSTLRSRQKMSKSPQNRHTVRLVVGLKDSALPNITHKLIYCATEQGKLLALRNLLSPHSQQDTSLRPPLLIFTQTIPRAIALHAELQYDIPASAGGSSRTAVLHSQLSSTQRAETMARFRAAEIWVLVTTDLLSRGVDFRGVNAVVNFDVPGSGGAYVHRVGRTGRGGREGGVAVTLYTKEDIPVLGVVAKVIAASEKQGGKVEPGVQDWLIKALPTVSKRARADLKKRGVEERRSGLDTNDRAASYRTRISTKSGYERRLENKRRGAVEGSKRRAAQLNEDEVNEAENDEAGEWSGLDD